jgi:alpha-mannosidase
MRIGEVASTMLFGGVAASPRQIVQVTLAAGTAAGPPGPVTVTIAGPGVSTPEPAVVTGPPPGGEQVAEVGIVVAAPASAGSTRPVTVIAEGPAGRAQRAAEVTVAEPGWTMWMVSHFHYDPVWWNTQGEFLQSRLLLPGPDGELPEVRTAFELVRLHLDEARRDRDYKFVLAEIDYLKPHFDAHPEDRQDLLDFIAAGRIELVGGSYNEPNTNLTGAESTIRNAVYGVAYQRDVLRGDPRSAWMLDAFGFDPAYPGLMAAAGMTSSSWARGPFHQWGPGRTAGDNRLMQFDAEFEWVSPDGGGLLTSYMANHYSAGWGTQHAADLAAAERDAYEQFCQLAPVAATRNVLLPVGGDHVIPSRWATAIHRDWNARYLWPRFVTAVPGEFFAAVRGEAASGDVWIRPQTRDMNPVYTGKDVTYIDTKQAQRAAETALLDGERLATLAWLAGAPYPAASLDKAWRLLVFGAHHDAITGTEGDQVYLDLLAGWREAWQRGSAARDEAVRHLAALADTASAAGPAGLGGPAGLAVVVVNTLSAARSGLVTTVLEPAGPGTGWLDLRDDAGGAVPFLAEGVRRHPDGTLAAVTVTFRAAGVPAVGYRTYLARPAAGPAPQAAGWQPVAGTEIENAALAVAADPARGGTLTSVMDRRTGTELLAGPGNELVLQEEYAQHPRWAEGPWLLCPRGPGAGSAGQPADVRAERCPIGSRLVARLRLGDLTVTQETLLWDGADRVEFRTHTGGSLGQDRLLRVAFPARVPGGLPVFQTAVSVIGRPLGPVDTDVADNTFTLDNPANEWFGVGSTARVAVGSPDGRQLQAIGVAEVVTPELPGDGAGHPARPAGGLSRADVRDLLVALARQGVTATCSLPDGPRYGDLAVDSNLPDFRISLGGPDISPFTAAVLAAAPAEVAAALERQLGAAGTARAWVPATRSRADAFAASADVRGVRDLPVLIIAGSGAAGLGGAVRAVTDDLADSVIEIPAGEIPGGAAPGGAAPGGAAPGGAAPGGAAPGGAAPGEPADAAGGPATALAGHSVALLNRGTPSSLVTPDGVATIALMRACSAWPCGVWIDGPPRTTPDGSSFAWQHWSHTFEYALAAGPGDWREAGFAGSGQDYNAALLAVSTDLHAGPLPGRASLASVEPPTAILSALKPRGNPLAPGPQPRPADGVTVRLRDIGGGPAPAAARVRLFTGLTAARAASLCEDAAGEPVPLAGDGAAEVSVPVAGMVTIDVTPAAPPWLAAAPARADAARGDAAGADSALPEPAQPIYARYWLHGKGPAPAGNMPVAVHLSPPRLAIASQETGSLRLTVACGPDPAAGEIQIAVPPGLDVKPAGPLAYDLPGRGHAAWDLTLRQLDGAAAGHRFVTARICDEAGQQIEDAVLVAAGETGPAGALAALDPAALLVAAEADKRAIEAEADLTVASRELTLAPGETGEIEVSVASRTAGAIHGEVQLISPWGSWACLPQWATGFSADAGAAATLGFPVTVPADARPGQRWWAVAKVMYWGRTRYSESVEIIIG